MHPKHKLTIFATGFILIIGSFLMTVLTVAKIWFRPPTDHTLQAQQQAQAGNEFWQQLRRIFNTPPKRIRYRRAGQEKVRRIQRGSAGGVPQTVSSSEQLAFREMVLGYFIKGNTYSNNPAEAMRESERSKLHGPWREYELTRLRTRILGYQFDESKNRGLLPEYKKAAIKAVESPFANFEDYFWAGHACLYSKDIRQAEKYFDLAHDKWPARETFFGYIHFFKMCLDAIDHRGEHLLHGFNDFRQVFPDWLYVEVYLMELDELQNLYPDAPLLWFLRGQIFEQVLNDAMALDAFRKALNSGNLNRAMTAAARVQINQIEQRR